VSLLYKVIVVVICGACATCGVLWCSWQVAGNGILYIYIVVSCGGEVVSDIDLMIKYISFIVWNPIGIGLQPHYNQDRLVYVVLSGFYLGRI
jgi:hypothetical protein